MHFRLIVPFHAAVADPNGQAVAATIRVGRIFLQDWLHGDGRGERAYFIRYAALGLQRSPGSFVHPRGFRLCPPVW